MYEDKKILGLIPARGGSKGLPRKNIKLLLGKPLIAWTIENAKKSTRIDRVIVSTDDEEISNVSKRYGAEAPFIRPKELASDEAKGVDVILHAMDWMETNEEAYDILVLLQPTAPLRISEDIDKAIELLFEKNAQAIVSVCELEYHPYLSNILPPDGCMRNFIKQEVASMNRQDMPPYFRLNGGIYLGYWDFIKKEKTFFGKGTFAYIMPQERSIDIDDAVDFKIAETLMRSALSDLPGGTKERKRT